MQGRTIPRLTWYNTKQKVNGLKEDAILLTNATEQAGSNQALKFDSE